MPAVCARASGVSSRELWGGLNFQLAKKQRRRLAREGRGTRARRVRDVDERSVAKSADVTRNLCFYEDASILVLRLRRMYRRRFGPAAAPIHARYVGRFRRRSRSRLGVHSRR